MMHNLPCDCYQTPKRKLPAGIGLVAVPHRKLQRFLSQTGSSPDSLEASQLLNQKNAFLPVIEEDDICSVVYAPNILVLSVPLELEAGGPLAAKSKDDSEMSADVTFQIAGGSTIRGKVLYSVPEDPQRVNRFLNKGAQLIPCDMVCLINRYKIVKVRVQH